MIFGFVYVSPQSVDHCSVPMMSCAHASNLSDGGI